MSRYKSRKFSVSFREKNAIIGVPNFVYTPQTCRFCKATDDELLLFTTHLVKSRESRSQRVHGKRAEVMVKFFSRKFWLSMDEKIGKPAFKSPPEPENVGGIIAAATQCSANY